MREFDGNLWSAIDSAAEKFYHQLDGLVPEDVYSKEWLEIVEDAIGPVPGYHDWVTEVWEPGA